MEPEDCYTIGDISQKYKLDESTVYKHIRKYSIPTRQIGKHESRKWDLPDMPASFFGWQEGGN